jgi:hypothetical protein
LSLPVYVTLVRIARDVNGRAGNTVPVLRSCAPDLSTKAEQLVSEMREQVEVSKTPIDAWVWRRGLRKVLVSTESTDAMPELMSTVFGETRVSPRVVQNQKTARCPARASP